MEKNNAPLLEMRNIKKGFFGNQVLTDINFTLEAGQDENTVWHGRDPRDGRL